MKMIFLVFAGKQTVRWYCFSPLTSRSILMMESYDNRSLPCWASRILCISLYQWRLPWVFITENPFVSRKRMLLLVHSKHFKCKLYKHKYLYHYSQCSKTYVWSRQRIWLKYSTWMQNLGIHVFPWVIFVSYKNLHFLKNIWGLGMLA